MNFSQRQGLTPVTKEIQISNIDQDLKNGLWNIYNLLIIGKLSKNESDYFFDDQAKTLFCRLIWHNYFKSTIDVIPKRYSQACEVIRDYFFRCQWFELYNLLEFSIEILNNRKFDPLIERKILFESFNVIFEREFAGYRIIDGEIAPITNSTEIAEIEESLVITDNFTSLKGCNIHLKTALSKLSDKANPDYRNSIKESVSAVESLAKLISNNANDSLGASLDKLKGKLKIHPALEQGFKKIYGYTSDSDGIRHAMTEESTCDFEDAKFMLVSCSAFINYLIMKAKKAGISFS